MRRPALIALATGLVATACVARPVAPAQDAVAALDARLLAAPTATGVLTAWCAEHGMADPARIRAEQVRGAALPASPEQRARLQVGADEPLGYRRVRLKCGTRTLSEAENWYVPSRLTPAMRTQLDETDTPFGTAIAALGPTRRNLEAVRLWQAGKPIPHALLRHRALVSGSDGRPLAEVVETYTRDILP
jgi:chorismate-pyruvate lyase